jgi:DNA-binding transcriptional MerR regulator
MAAVGMKTGMKIGALAGRNGLPVKTLRYYEDLGLLPAIGRSEGGYRLFAEESLRRLEFIRKLKTLGLSLEEIQGCLAVHDAGDLPCDDIAIQLECQIERIDGQIKGAAPAQKGTQGPAGRLAERSRQARRCDLPQSSRLRADRDVRPARNDSAPIR